MYAVLDKYDYELSFWSDMKGNSYLDKIIIKLEDGMDTDAADISSEINQNHMRVYVEGFYALAQSIHYISEPRYNEYRLEILVMDDNL